MEQKLTEYRAKKQRDIKMNNLKTKINQFFTDHFQRSKPKPPCDVPQVQEALLSPSESPEQPTSETSSICEENISFSCSYSQILYYVLWFCLWAVLYAIFIQLQFGTVFLILSGIVFMFVNTRTGPRTSEMSAYSVFNKDCKSIDGSLTAEQFEREIRYGR